MRVKRLEEGSSNITYDYKNSSIENNFLIKFQNFCRKHFLITLYINIGGFVIRDNEKRDHHHLPHSPPSEVEGVRIVFISFRKIAKK